MKLRVAVDGSSYDVEIIDLGVRPVVAIVDGERFEVWPESSTAAPAIAAPSALSRSITRPEATGHTGGAVLAPIPGVIVAVKVKPGDRVAVGQELCVLEAMKMQNVIRSRQAGFVATVDIAEGQQVKHHQPLLIIEPD